MPTVSPNHPTFRPAWPLYGLTSLAVHLGFGALFAAWLFAPPPLPQRPVGNLESVAVTLVDAPRPRPATVEAPAPALPRPMPPRETGSATGTVARAVAPKNGTEAEAGRPGPVGPNRPDRPRTGGGGGSPAPAADLTGSGGVKAPIAPVEDVLFSGGGRGGADLPRVAPRAGGGDGNTPAADLTPRLDIPQNAPNMTPTAVRAPSEGAGTVAGAGVGFRPGAGIGTAPFGPAARATVQRADDGRGIGAAASGDNTGTRSPGGGRGDGSTLPGTGGEGTGYGRGSGSGFGDGRRGGEGAGGDGGGGGRGALFGVGRPPGGGDGPLHVVYVIDVSLSMEDLDKIGVARAALQEALSGLTPADSFNIVPFDGKAHPLWDAPRPATPENLNAARRFVDALRLGEGTNLGAGLEKALAAAPLTQVYLLSDGHPTVGITDDRRLWEAAKAWNVHRAKIEAIGIGFGQAFEGVNLLKRIAGESGGTFEFIDVRRARERRSRAAAAVD